MIKMPHLTWRQRLAVGAGCLVLAAAGGLDFDAQAGALPLPRHDITGFAAHVACTPTAGLDWTFTSSNSNGHTIVSAQFDRRVDAISQTATTVAVHSTEKPGPTSLKITVVWEDQHVSSFVASTVMLDGVCPPPETVPATTTPAPTTTAPPAPATTVPPAPTSIAPVDSTVATPATVPATAAVAPSTTVHLFLPTTGSSSNVVVVAGVGALLVGALLLLARRRAAS